MDAIRVTRSDLVGKSTSNTLVMETLIRANALNRTGDVNYNENGLKDSVGFEEVTEKFVDNFLFRVLVPDYNIKKGKNMFIGTQNKMIRDLLDANRLEKCVVQAILFKKVQHEQVPKEILKSMPNADINKLAEVYYFQDFKIACPNKDYLTVMKFLREEDYKGYGFFLKDVDITKDYAGSFDKYEVVNQLTSMQGFREQGSVNKGEEYPRTIIDNDAMVGKNCLTWMEKIDGFTTRQKIYNKYVQMLECKSVRNRVGCHWKDWVCQTETRLANARDKAKERGLTRAEVTFTIDDEIPNESFIDEVLQSIVRYIPKSIVYSTSYASTWKTYCNTFKHSLVCVDRSKDIGIIVYSYNEETCNISGQFIKSWNEREKWCLDKLTFNGNLPLDIIEVVEVSKIFENGKKNIVLEINGNRYCKINKDKSTRCTTRLVSNGGVYCANGGTLDENNGLLEKAGMLEHENCIPYLAKTKDSLTSKADVELRKLETLHVNLWSRKENKKSQEEQFKEKCAEEFKKIEEKTKPLFVELKQEKRKLDWKNECKQLFYGDTTPLRDLCQGIYILNVAKMVNNSKFGKQYMLSLGEKENPTIVWSNKYITNKLQEAEDLKCIDVDDIYLSLRNKKLGSLQITGKGDNMYGRATVFCQLTLNPKEETESNLPMTKIVKCVENDLTPIIPRENLLNYREYPNLAYSPVGSVHNVDGWGYIKHYGTERLVVSLDGKIFQGGDDLEEKVSQLKHMCKIKIDKIRTNINRHVKYAVCSVFEKGDWTASVEYGNVPILPKNEMDGETCVLDIRTVEVKGQKRKLLLTQREDGDAQKIYKLKKSKLEENIKVGFI